MNPKATKNINLFATVLFTLGGFACLGLAGYLTLTPAPPKQAQYISQRADKPGCLKAAREMGFEVTKAETSMVNIHSSDLDSSPKEIVDKASLVIAACHVPMRSFCMGEACPAPGITFMLQFNDLPRITK